MRDQKQEKSEHNCNEGHECPDKEKCFEMLQSYLDGEISIESDQLKAKLEKCLPCYNHYQLEECIKNSLKTKVEQPCLPADLAETIRLKLKQTA